ncbi:MAG: pantoate--beta-alanine ligase [Mariprofundaceae bacterium]
MIVVESSSELREARGRAGGGPVVFVPTMGCLHAGHMALIEAARRHAGSDGTVIVSIYVNPLQFGPNEDFAAYPRTFEADRTACEAAGVDILFHPPDLYPDGAPQVRLSVAPELAGCLCGAARPGHFDGVATVVAKLFHLTAPDAAVFGEKDWQQLTIIRRMAADLDFGIRILAAPTVREPDGLAMSSRNRYLNEDERRRAPALHRALAAMRERAAAGERDAGRLIDIGAAMLEAADITPEYLEIRDGRSLRPLTRLGDAPARAFVAARVGPARLIDNLALTPEENSP